MVIKVFNRNEIDSVMWDRFIESTPQKTIYALSWFLDLIPQKWGAVIELNSKGEWLAVLPFQTKKKYGLTKIEQNAFTNELGVYSLPPSHPQALVQFFLKKYKFISRYYFNSTNQFDFLNQLSFETTFHLPLNTSYQSLKKGYSNNRIRSSNKNQYLIESRDIYPLLSLFKQNVASNIYGIEDSQYELLKSIYDIASNKGLAYIVYVKNEFDEILSGTLFVKSFDRLVYFFSASTPAGWANNSQALLIDYVIKHNADTNTILDFEGGSIDGIGKFYRSFGAQELKIYSYRKMLF